MPYRSILNQLQQAAMFGFLFVMFTLPAYGQATQVPNAQQQFIDANGNPYANGKVFMYVPNTTTKKNTWKDATQTQLNTNPVVLDSAGRAIIFGVGNYNQLLQDAGGLQVWNNFTAAPAGASSSTPATSGAGDFLPIGAIIPISGFSPPVNYMLAYGQAISRTTYPDAFNALTIVENATCTNGSPTLTTIADTSNFRVGQPVEASCVASGSLIQSLTTSSITLNNNASLSGVVSARVFPWSNGDGVNTFNIPDFRGRVLMGANAMGGTASSRVSSTYYGSDPNTPVGNGGAQFAQLSGSNLPSITPVGTVSSPHITTTVSAPGATTTVNNGTGVFTTGGTAFQNFASGGGGPAIVNITATTTVNAPSATSSLDSAPTFTGTPTGGASAPFSLFQPTFTVNYAVKITNGTLPLVGVLSFGGLTGDLLCGAGVTCDPSTNTVSFNASTAQLWQAGSGSNIYYNVGKVGINLTSPTALLDVGGNASTNAQAIFTRGVSDPNFQLVIANGTSGTGIFTSQATMALQYVGGGSGPAIQFQRGTSTTDGYLVLNPTGNQVIVGPGLPPVGIVNVKGSVTPSGASSIVFYGEGYGSAGSLSNNAVTLILRDYSNAHSAAISIDAVNSAGTLVQNAFEFNPGFVSWDAGHEQGDIDFNSFINGTLQGVMAWNAGCNVLNVGCSIPTNPAFVGDGNGITDLGYTSRRWRSVNAAVLNLSNTTNTGYGIVTSTSTGTTYDSAGHQFLTGGVLVGAAPTGGNKGVGTINIAGDIYKNNTAYTNPDYVFEQAFTDKIVKFADRFGAAEYKPVTLDQAEQTARTTLRLPGITDAPMGAFERSDKLLEKVEEAYLHMFELNARLKKAEACMSSWKCRLFGL